MSKKSTSSQEGAGEPAGKPKSSILAVWVQSKSRGLPVILKRKDLTASGEGNLFH